MMSFHHYHDESTIYSGSITTSLKVVLKKIDETQKGDERTQEDTFTRSVSETKALTTCSVSGSNVDENTPVCRSGYKEQATSNIVSLLIPHLERYHHRMS